MKKFLSNMMSAVLNPWHYMSREQFAKVWVSAVLVVFTIALSAYPIIAKYILTTASSVAIVICIASFIVTKMFGNVERLEPLNNHFKKLGDKLADYYSESFKGDESYVQPTEE